MPVVKKNLLVLLALTIIESSALSFELSLAGGFYRAPSSQYMYALSGIEVASPKAWGTSLSVSALKRPEYINGPFIENDEFYFARLRYEYTNSKNLKIFSAIGYGAQIGSIRNIETLEAEEYTLKGPSIGLGLSLYLTNDFYISLTQNNLIAFTTEEQTNAYVAWPYQIYLLNFGFHI